MPLLYIKDCVDCLIGLYEADNTKLKRRVYAIAGFSPTAKEIYDEVKRVLPNADIKLGWLGGQVAVLLVARRLIQKRQPSSTCHRFVGAVAPHKFRSRKRERILRHARQLLHVIAEWEGLFAERFFPRFATRSGFG